MRKQRQSPPYQVGELATPHLRITSEPVRVLYVSRGGHSITYWAQTAVCLVCNQEKSYGVRRLRDHNQQTCSRTCAAKLGRKKLGFHIEGAPKGISSRAHYTHFKDARNRCHDSRLKNQHYRDRGTKFLFQQPDGRITYDDYLRWEQELGPKLSPDDTVDRWPDPCGDYAPGNIQWASKANQNKHKCKDDRLLQNSARAA